MPNTDKTSAHSSLQIKNPSKLLGQYNYLIWARTWKVAFRACQWWDIFNGNIVRPTNIKAGKTLAPTEPAEATSGTDTHAVEVSAKEWDLINDQALHLLHTAVDSTILHNISIAETAAEAWPALKNLYDHETATSITLLKAVLDNKLKEGGFIQNHLENFSSNWNRLLNRCLSATDELPSPMPPDFDVIRPHKDRILAHIATGFDGEHRR